MRGQRTIAHIWSTTTIHVRRDRITGGKTEIRKLNDDLALTDAVLVKGPTRGDNEILRLDVTMKHGRIVAGSYGHAHKNKNKNKNNKKHTRSLWPDQTRPVQSSSGPC